MDNRHTDTGVGLAHEAPIGLSVKIADWIAGLKPADVPQEVRKQLRLLLLDALGSATHGRSQTWSAQVKAWLLHHPSAANDGLATLWGDTKPSLRPSDAAFGNGVFIHAFEFDDYHNAKVHPSCAIVPAVLAVAEAHKIRGERILLALAAGYEVMIRSALALNPAFTRVRGWHLTGVSGTLGAAAACASLLGLSAERTLWALGLAGTRASGIFAFTIDGAMSKKLHPGFAAQAGVMAVEMAEAGITGPTQIFEAEDGGFLKVYSDRPRWTYLIEDLGTIWHAAGTNFKPYACCGSSHVYVDAARDLRGQWQRGGRIRAGLARVVQLQCGYAYEPTNEQTAQLCIAYCIAVALNEGHALPAHFSANRIADPELTKLAQSVEIVHDEELDALYPENFAGWLEIDTDAGPQRIFARNPSGNPSNPQWEQVLREKYRLLTKDTIGTINAAQLEQILDRIETTQVGDIVSVMAAS